MRPPRRTLVALFALPVMLATSGSGWCQPEPTARVILVLDASGSMWGKVGDRTKIEIAREVIRGLLGDWDPSVHLGLTAYGHRRKGDCSDIEALIAVGPVDRGAFVSTVEAINPKGKTPLSQAVIQAALDLRHTEEKATVILVSDGEETCDLDPCEVGRELEEAGVDFTTHVIGFDVQEEGAIAQLRCLAENTGGQFTLADNANTLRKALDRAIQWARVSLRAPRHIFTDLGFEVEWTGPDAQGDKIVLVPEGSPEGASDVHAATAAGSPARMVGPETTGPHEVRYMSGGQTLLSLSVTVRKSAASLSAPESVSAGAEFEVTWKGPDSEGDRIVLVEATESGERYFTGEFSAPTSKGSPVKLRAFAEPGDYEVRYIATRGARVLARQPLTITPSGASVKGPAKVEAGVGFEVNWTGPDSGGDQIVLVEKSTEEGRYMTGEFSARTSKGSPVKLRAYSEPGEYEIRYLAHADGKVLARADLTIGPSTAGIEAPREIEAGTEFDVEWRGPDSKGDRIVLVKASTQEGSYTTKADFNQPSSGGSPLRLTASSEPGDYEIRYQAGAGGKALARSRLLITASKASVQAPASVAAGAELQVSWSGPNSKGDRIVLVKASTPEGSYFTSSDYQASTAKGSPVTLRAFVERGSYEVRYMAEADGKTLAVARIEIK